MKTRIKGKIYNPSTAKLIGKYSTDANLYQKPDEEYFLVSHMDSTHIVTMDRIEQELIRADIANGYLPLAN